MLYGACVIPKIREQTLNHCRLPISLEKIFIFAAVVFDDNTDYDDLRQEETADIIIEHNPHKGEV